MPARRQAASKDSIAICGIEADIGKEHDTLTRYLDTGKAQKDTAKEAKQQLADRYETPLPQMTDRATGLEEKVNAHLAKMGFV